MSQKPSVTQSLQNGPRVPIPDNMDKSKTQVEKFREAAREIEADESEAAWDDKLRKLLGAPSKGEADKIEKSEKAD